jgi:hypothetical protein
MSTVDQVEKKTQQRIVKLFREDLVYDYLGDWTDREGNANIETALLHAWLKKRGVGGALVTRALHILEKTAGDTGKSLYDRNRAVYGCDYRLPGLAGSSAKKGGLKHSLASPGEKWSTVRATIF